MNSFDPFMFVSLSGSCATSKLIQCRSFGIGVCDVSPKFEKDVSEVPDLHPKDFRMRRKVVNYVRKWCSKSRARGEWTPILYAYEVRSDGTVLANILTKLSVDCSRIGK